MDLMRTRTRRCATVVLLGALQGGATCLPREAPTKVDEQAKPTVGPGDVVEVRVFGEPELSGIYQVGIDGSVRMPLVGNVPVTGMTADEMTSTIEEKYNERYLKNAQINVLVKEFNSRKIYVLGAVGRPGAFAFSSRMTVLDAVLLAGGPSPIANANGTIITRRTDKGDLERMSVAVASIGKGTGEDVELKPGDIVYVPESLF
jgi:protein involved in polysaccharide export with SLBB domain